MVLRELVLTLLVRWRSFLVAFAALTAACLVLAQVLAPVSDGPTSTRLEFVASSASAEEAKAGAAYVPTQVYAWLAVTQRDEVVREAITRSGARIAPQEASRRLALTVPQQNVITFGLPGVRAATAVPLLDAWAAVVCERVQPTIPTGASGAPLATCTQATKAAPTPSAASVATRRLNVPLSFLVGFLGAIVLVLARESWARDRARAAAPTLTSRASGPALAVGVDVEDVARWTQRRRLEDLFTPTELARARATTHPERSFAGWWAAREATVKALTDEGVTLRQVHVEHDDDGRPRVVVAAREDLTARLSLSISHSDRTAVAVVILRP